MAREILIVHKQGRERAAAATAERDCEIMASDNGNRMHIYMHTCVCCIFASAYLCVCAHILILKLVAYAEHLLYKLRSLLLLSLPQPQPQQHLCVYMCSTHSHTCMYVCIKISYYPCCCTCHFISLLLI